MEYKNIGGSRRLKLTVATMNDKSTTANSEVENLYQRLQFYKLSTFILGLLLFSFLSLITWLIVTDHLHIQLRSFEKGDKNTQKAKVRLDMMQKKF